MKKTLIMDFEDEFFGRMTHRIECVDFTDVLTHMAMFKHIKKVYSVVVK